MRVVIVTVAIAMLAIMSSVGAQPPHDPNQVAIDPATGEVIWTAASEVIWTAASVAFDPSLAETFVHNEFVLESNTEGYPERTVLPFSGDSCPLGWEQLTDEEDEAPLFYAFGLLVDAKGSPRTDYVRMPACMKQRAAR